MSLEEEIAHLRVENAQLKEQLRFALEQLAEALARIKLLEEEVERVKSAPPSFVKPNTNTPRTQDPPNYEKRPRRKRAKDQNGARRREQTPTQTIQHTIQVCPDCGYGLRQGQLASRRQVIELPPPGPVEVTEHQLFKS